MYKTYLSSLILDQSAKFFEDSYSINIVFGRMVVKSVGKAETLAEISLAKAVICMLDEIMSMKNYQHNIILHSFSEFNLIIDSVKKYDPPFPLAVMVGLYGDNIFDV